MNRDEFDFGDASRQRVGPTESQAIEKTRMSQIQGGGTSPDRQLTQRFDAERDFHNLELEKEQDRMKSAANADDKASPGMPPLKLGKAANFLGTHKTEDLPTPKKSQALDSILIEIMNDEEQFYELENFLSEEKSYDVDSLAFYVKVMEFKKETSGVNATLAAGMIIDNYLTEDAQYYIGSEIKSDALINRLIGEYEQTITHQSPVPKSLFDDVCEQIRQQLMPYLREFKMREA